ncbi:hypothetical protein, partial [Streptomyces djakartensis]|uniref:hypothetical protein n=1 Tax=Streptomyces djakartensis TaxID=68193 RepID=UPI0034DE25CE
SLVLIQEPWLDGKGKICGLKAGGFSLYHFSYEDEGKRAYILVKSNIHFLFSQELSDDDTATVALKQGVDTIYFVSAYFPGNEDSGIPNQKVIDITLSKKKVVVGCDANAHNESYGSTNTNFRGECLLDFIIDNDLNICNRGKESTHIFGNGLRKEVLDVTFSSLSLVSCIKDWKVWDIDSFSDHRFVKFNVDITLELRPPSRNPRKTNWETFREEIGSRT